MNDTLSLAETADYLQSLRGKVRILCSAHIRPDGDALGALCGLLNLLRDNGFEADAVCPADIPDYFYSFLPDAGLIPEPDAAALTHYGLFISLDCSRRDRNAAVFFAEGRVLPFPTLNIDHHPDNPKFAERNLISDTAGATAQIIAELAFQINWHITPETANLLMIGLLTDTGGFRFRNTSPAGLRTAAKLMERGADYDRIINACFFSKPENMARFEADLLCNHLKKQCSGKYMSVFFSPELLAQYQIELRNTEQVIEILRAIHGPFIVATIRKENGGFKCSLRSKDPRYSAGRIARKIGGGGHEMAAGCTINVSSVEEAEQILLHNVEIELNENPS